MAIFPFVILRRNEQKSDAVMVNHERIHIRQQMELLVVFFYLWYGVEFLCRWVQYRSKDKAYRNISFEREAYQNEKDPGYLKRRSFWSFWNYV